MKKMIVLLIVLVAPFTLSCAKKIKVGPEDARVIAKNAYIYGFPIVENYKMMYAYSVYKDSGHFRAPFNTLAVVTPDTAVTDSARAASGAVPKTPYAIAWLDLRKEPVIITVPLLKEDSRYRIDLIDLYTYHFDELNTDKSGNAGGSFMIVPANWTGKTPDNIVRVIGCETSFALAIIRGHSAIIQAPEATEAFLMAFNVERLSSFTGTKPPAAEALIFPPYSQETANSAGFFQYMNFMLQFCPVHPSEIHERADFAKLGIAGGKRFDLGFMDKAILDAVNGGMADARSEIAEAAAKTPEDRVMYGTRADLKNDFLARAVAAGVRLYGPPKQ
ncbi:MAG TPA: DUF1254 domain-containing protein [Candidatus Krumholzibacteria bacterium]|nr:DUF1254 domain-containing protein [Candidatus Krumholzibacteria bacterium]